MLIFQLQLMVKLNEERERASVATNGGRGYKKNMIRIDWYQHIFQEIRKFILESAQNISKVSNF